jgi:thioredoxin 1
MGAITELTEATFSEEIGSATEPVVVDFWAEWCGPCKAVAPTLEEIATEQDGKLRIAKLNVDDHQGVALQYSVMSIPTMIVFKDGREVHRIVGAKGKAQLLEEFAPFL